MPPKGYSNLSIPTELLNAIREAVEHNHSLYTSIDDFVKEALRMHLLHNASPKHSKSPKVITSSK